MLTKERKLRKMEFVFTDDQVHPECHCLYQDIIKEDGVEIIKKNHRETRNSSDCRSELQSAAEYIHPEYMP